MTTRLKILLGILVIVALLYVYMTFIKSAGTDQQKTAVKSTAEDVQQVRKAQKLPIPEEFLTRKDTTVVFTGTWGVRDPFFRVPRPKDIVVKERELGNLVYQGLMGNTVLISGETYRLGDEINGKTITTISEEYVILEGSRGEEVTLRLGGKQ